MDNLQDYNDVMDAINQYFDSDGDRWTQTTSAAQTACEINQYANSSSNITTILTQSGDVRGYTMPVTQVPTVTGNPADSNTTNTGYFSTGSGGVTPKSFTVPAQVNTDPSTGDYVSTKSGFIDALGGVVNGVSNMIGVTAAAAACMAMFGLDVTRDFYTGNFQNLGVDWNRYIDVTNSLGRDSVLSVLDGRWATQAFWSLDSNGNIQLNLPDDVIAYLYGTMRDGGMIKDITKPVSHSIPSGMNLVVDNGYVAEYPTQFITSTSNGRYWTEWDMGNCKCFAVNRTSGWGIYLCRLQSGQWVARRRDANSRAALESADWRDWNVGVGNSYTFNNKQVWYSSYFETEALYDGVGNISSSSDRYGKMAWCLWYEPTDDPTLPPGISPRDGTTFINPTIINGDTINNIWTQMVTYYPTIFGGPGITNTFPDGSCNNVTINYHPVTIPITIGGPGDIFPVTAPITIAPQINPSLNISDFLNNYPDYQFDPSIYGEFSVEDLINLLITMLLGGDLSVGASLDPNLTINIEIINNYNGDNNVSVLPTDPIYPPPDPDDPRNPDIEVPPVINEDDPSSNPERPSITTPTSPPNVPDPVSYNPPLPAVDDYPSALWTVYNPTKQEVNSFGAWLWSANFVDNIKRLFQSPMDAVITLHKIYTAPISNSTSTIVCGYLDSGVSSKVVSSQYKYIDCGSVSVQEYYGNVFDYAPYTSYHLYLPFIGIVELNPADIVRGVINIQYAIDVFSGACTAKVRVTRDALQVCIAEYAGNCAVEFPVTQGSYASVISATISAGMSALGVGIMTMGAPGTAALGAATAGAKFLQGSRLNVQRSGSLNSAAGATGYKTPYMIISRPQAAMAQSFDHFTGWPANQTTQISNCSGFTKGTISHILSKLAYKDELDEITEMFKSGVFC